MSPKRLVGVIGTHTEVGKTWVSQRWLAALRARGYRVAARKPVQSFSPNTGATDAEQLAAVTGESLDEVCPAHRWYPLAMAPPMAADALSKRPFQLRDIAAEIRWPDNIDVGIVETVGGARSPLAHDGDSIDLLSLLKPDDILLVADAGLGTINAVRLTLACLKSYRVHVYLNHFEATERLHVMNRAWLERVDGIVANTTIEELIENIMR